MACPRDRPVAQTAFFGLRLVVEFQGIDPSTDALRMAKEMDRREFLGRSTLYSALMSAAGEARLTLGAAQVGKGASSPDPIMEPHFPDRLHLFIWRNWELTNVDRMAKVLGTTPEKILEIGVSMGLPAKPAVTHDQLRRFYITIIRENWHVLPDDQLIELLGWDSRHYDYTLREDDFLWMKLGLVKPRCERLRYEEPTPAARRRAAEIKRLVRGTFGSALDEPGEPAFQFVHDLSTARTAFKGGSSSPPAENEVDLSRGWTLIKAPEGPGIPPRLLEEFRTYLQAAFGCEIAWGKSVSPGSKWVELRIDGSIGHSPGSFELTVEPEKILVAGSDVAGIRQGLYLLQDQMEERQAPYVARGAVSRTAALEPRYVYSYFALYGDPLWDTEIDPFPGGFVEKLARVGVSGVWLQAVLRNLAPSQNFPEFGEGWQVRLKNLDRLVKRAQDFGIKIYLYLNEPRSMPAAFYASHPQVKGTTDADDAGYFAMCTSTPEVRAWLRDSLAHVFAEVPGLGGVFCITASENLTNCYSHDQAQQCPRCSKRPAAEVVAEVIATFRDGVRHSSVDAKVIAWDWGWGPDWVPRGAADAKDIIERLPRDVALLSVSEWNQPIDLGGVKSKVGEYSISAGGPGPRALRNWSLARERGLATMAKVQWSTTWEISAVPYIPVPNLIARHCQNLRKAEVQGLMASWTVGGYPSPNFDVAREFYYSPSPRPEQALERVAVRRYGKAAAPGILRAWKAFSQAFEEFPFVSLAIYMIPTQHGPANPLRLRPTGYRAGVMLFPYDDYKAWAGPFPVEVVERQFDRMSELWKPALASFYEALPRIPEHKRDSATKDLGIAETCYIHFQSVANQLHFYRWRDRWLVTMGDERAAIAKSMITIAQNEMELAKRQYAITKRDCTIAFEASNHYYYRPLSLVEKILNCQYVVDQISMSM
jgi:hypothetical protein